jgi:thymidylate synthase
MRVYKNEEGYVQLLKDILANKNKTPDRTGCGTQKNFGATLDFPDVTKAFPLFTGRPVPFYLCFEEIMFFLNGRVQTKELEAIGVNFWKKHTSRTFLDGRKLNYLPEGHMGWAYGAVMRHAGGTYDSEYNPTGGFDQLADLIKQLQDDTNLWSRRAMIELWSPENLSRMALTPCCHNYNFSTTMGDDGEPELNLAIKIRSSDTLFGLGGANAPQFGFLLMAMAKLIGVKAKCLSLIIIDAHIYSGGYGDQIAFAEEAITRELYPLPQMVIEKDLNTMEDLLALTIDDIQFVDYKRNKTKMVTPRPPMAV